MNTFHDLSECGCEDKETQGYQKKLAGNFRFRFFKSKRYKFAMTGHTEHELATLIPQPWNIFNFILFLMSVFRGLNCLTGIFLILCNSKNVMTCVYWECRTKHKHTQPLHNSVTVITGKRKGRGGLAWRPADLLERMRKNNKCFSPPGNLDAQPCWSSGLLIRQKIMMYPSW